VGDLFCLMACEPCAEGNVTRNDLSAVASEMVWWRARLSEPQSVRALAQRRVREAMALRKARQGAMEL